MADGAAQREPIDNGELVRIQQLLRLHRPGEAATAARAALATSPEHHDFTLLLVSALVDLDATDDAVGWAEQGCRAHPNSANMHAARAEALRAGKRLNAAIDAAETSLRLDPVNVTHLLLHAECLTRYAEELGGTSNVKGEALEGAAMSADRARQLAPNVSATHFVRGKIHLVSKEWAALETCARTGLSLDPDSAAGHQLLGVARAKQNDKQAAGDHFVTAGRADPHSGDVGEMLTWLKSSPWQWVIVAVFLMIPILSFLDSSFQAWMWGSLLLGVAGAAWLRFRPSIRLSQDAEAARRRARRLR